VKTWASLGVPSSPTISRRKTTRPEGTPLDLRLPHGEIVIILICKPWAVGWSPEGLFSPHKSMGKIGQNPTIGQIWRPVAPQPYVAQKSWSNSETPWLLDYNSCSKKYLSKVHPVTCSLLWVRCLFDRFSISDFGGKWPVKWKFLKMFSDSATGHRNTFRHQIWWKSAVVKLPKGRVVYQTKTTRAQDSSQPPFWPEWADRA